MLKLDDFLYIIFALPIVVWTSWRGWIKAKVADLFMQQFATANGFTYEAVGIAKGMPGTMFKLGHSKEVEDVVSGIYETYPVRLFTYHYTVGSGRSSRTYDRMVFETTLPTKLHRILLRSRNQKLSSGAFSGFDHPNEIKLGAPFDTAFELGADQDYEIEALEVVTPTFMEYLLALPLRFSIELVEDKLYIYSDKVITKSYELRYFFDIAREVTTHLAPIATRLKDDVAALDQFYKK